MKNISISIGSETERQLNEIKRMRTELYDTVKYNPESTSEMIRWAIEAYHDITEHAYEMQKLKDEIELEKRKQDLI